MLPQELVDRIIDEIHDDQSALATCALVNKSWVDRSRHHLFHTLSLQITKESIVRFLDLCHHVPSGVKPFFLCDVRHFRFYKLPQRPLPGGEQRFSLSPELVSCLASSFPNVNTVTIDIGGPIEPNTSSILHSVFGRVTTLVLGNLYFPDTSKLAFLLAGFPALELLDLHVNFSIWPHCSDMQLFGFEFPASGSLRTLKLNSRSSRVLYPWFSSSHQKLPKLSSLTLILYDPDPTHIGNLFAKYGLQLEELRLSMYDLPDPARFTGAHERWNFTSLRNLRFLAIQWLQHDVPMFLSRVLPCLPALEVIQLGFRNIQRTSMCNRLPSPFVEVLESFGTRQLSSSPYPREGTHTKLPQRSIIIYIHVLMPRPTDDIQTDKDANQEEIRNIEHEIKMALPLCSQSGVLDLRITIGPYITTGPRWANV